MTRKNGDNRTREELLDEIEQLRFRLDEAEQTLDAIRSGDVDALVVAGPHGDQIFSLTGSERVYRQIIETMNEGALTVSLDGTILFCNQRFCSLLHYPMAALIGRNCADLSPPAQLAQLKVFLDDAQAGPLQQFFHLRVADGGTVPVNIAASMLVTETENSICLVVSDLTALEAQANSINDMLRQKHTMEVQQTELLASNEELRDSQRAALNLVKDVEIARRKAEEANKELQQEILVRAQIEEKLQESEEQLRTLADSIPNLAWWANGDGYITWYNRRWFEYTGTTPEQMEGWGWQSVHDPGELPKVMERWQASIATGEPFEMTFPLRGADGVFRPFLTRVIPLKDVTGFVLKWFGTNTDVSELKRAEEALRQQSESALRLSEQEFRSLAEAMPQIVWATRPDGWNIYFNQKWVDYTGLTMEESYGHGWNTPFHPDDKQRAWDAWQRATQHNEQYSLECRLRRADGVYRWWLIRGEPMRGANGEILKWFGTCTDIEEIKRAETVLHEANALLEQRVAERTAALRESEALYRGIGESIDYGVWVCAPDGRNTYASESFLNMVGITQEQCSNFGWGNVLHPDDAERTIAAWQECVRTGGKWDIEHRFRGKDGQWHHVLARGVPVRNEHGEIISWAGINLDITDLKKAEELIKASLAEKEVMLREIHHRVKNNLQVISSLVSLQADTLDDERMRAVFGDVRDRVRAMALVHEKLYQTGDLAHLNFADYAASLLQYLWRSYGAQAEDVRFNLAVAPVALPIEAAVPCGLILNELAGNALKHAFPSGRDGEVAVGLELDPAGGTLCLRVCDNGVGLPAGLEWRQSRSLGLRLVQMLAGQLRGKVETGPGPGTEFLVTFPLKGFNP